MTTLQKIQHAGFDLSVNETGALIVRPASKLNREQCDFLRTHKAEIIQELRKADQAANEIIKRFVACYTPEGNPIQVEARDSEHAEWLVRMNPAKDGNQ